jgi:hypothetical protein
VPPRRKAFAAATAAAGTPRPPSAAGAPCPGGAPPARLAPSPRPASAGAAGGLRRRAALLDDGDDLALPLRDVDQAVARALTPDGHVLEDGGVVADDLEPVPGGEPQQFAHREQDRQRAEGPGHVETASDGSGHGDLLGAGSVASCAAGRTMTDLPL